MAASKIHVDLMRDVTVLLFLTWCIYVYSYQHSCAYYDQLNLTIYLWYNCLSQSLLFGVSFATFITKFSSRYLV